MHILCLLYAYIRYFILKCSNEVISYLFDIPVYSTSFMLIVGRCNKFDVRICQLDHTKLVIVVDCFNACCKQ